MQSPQKLNNLSDLLTVKIPADAESKVGKFHLQNSFSRFKSAIKFKLEEERRGHQKIKYSFEYLK